MEAYSTYSDNELAVLLKTGDSKAYAEIYERFWGILYRYSRKLLQSDNEADDVVQDTFVMLWSKAADLELRISLSSFLYASVRNSILKKFKHSKVKDKYLASLDKFMDEGNAVTDHLVRERELAARIEYEVSLLPDKMREIFLMSRRENLSYKEIAERLGIAENTVKKQIFRALRALKLKFGSMLTVALTLL